MLAVDPHFLFAAVAVTFQSSMLYRKLHNVVDKVTPLYRASTLRGAQTRAQARPPGRALPSLKNSPLCAQSFMRFKPL